MQLFSLFALGVLSAILLNSCAGFMSGEFRDAETMKRGEGEGAVRVMMVADGGALLRDSLFDGGAEIVAPALGVGGYYGITDRLEVNAGAWSSTLFLSPVLSFRTFDLGARGGIKVMVTPTEWRHNVALGLSGWWHGGINLFARFDDDLRYYGTAYGLDPSLVYSYRLSKQREHPGVRSVYIGGRFSFARADYTYGYSGGDSSASVTVREYHGPFSGIVSFLGVRTANDFFAEVGVSILEHPESKKIYWIPALGISWRVGQ